jgi:hypothetical protein
VSSKWVQIVAQDDALPIVMVSGAAPSGVLEDVQRAYREIYGVQPVTMDWPRAAEPQPED